MVASSQRPLGGVSLLLLVASFAFLQQTQAFYDSPSRVTDLLGDHQVRVNQDGYVDFAETRVNIYGERSSVAYRYKPHVEKLKLRVDHSCFSIKSLDGKVILQAKNDLFSSRSSSHDCLHSSVTSLTSTEDFTGRTFAFSSQQPSIHDVRSGDILLGVSDMHGKPEFFKITSVSQRSVARHSSKADFEFAVQPVQITDLVSEGEYEFHTDNILTVNDIARSKMTTKGDTQFGPRDLASMNWNYNSGAGQASSTITLWKYQTALILCTNCFARFTAKATIKWMIEREHWYSKSVTVKFMAHVVMNAQMNFDVGFSFNGALSHSIPSVRLARLQSMVGAALSSLSIFGVNLRIGLDYGLDISVGVDFEVEGALDAFVGADAQCSYAVGIYHNYAQPYNQNGCSKQLHSPSANGEAGIVIIPYISLQPYINIRFGNIVKATATVTIKPKVEFRLSFSVDSGFEVNSIILHVPVTFDAQLSVQAPLGLYSNSWSYGPYTLMNPSWQLMDHSHSISVRSQNLIPSIDSSGKLRILSTGNQSNPLSSIKNCEACKISNDTIVWNPLGLSAALDTSTTSWQKVDAYEDGVGTCTYTSGQVDARTIIFTAPSTGLYEVSSSLVQTAPDSTGNSWNVLARIGPNCCGILTFCSSISVDQPSSIWSVFLTQNDTFTMEYTSSVAGSDATIRVKISGSQDPIVYLDTISGVDSNTGIFGQPVQSFEEALDLLASKITPQTIAATVIVSPTFDASGANHPMCPGRDYPKMAGYAIPTQLKNIDLTIKSVVRLRATSIMFSWGKQANYGGYCNYLTDPLCAKSSAFRESVRGTAFDTEFVNHCEDSSSVWGVRRVFTFENFKSVTLDGLWIQDFRNHKDGGALYAENSTLILKNCWFEGNSALQAGSGGALYAKNSKVLIDGTVFMSQATHNYGGAIMTIASDLEITRSAFSGALADKEGGFISFDSSKGNTISVTDCEFFEASAYSGAGIVINGGRGNTRRNIILNSRFAGLSASTKGGAVLLQNSNLQIALSEFKNTYSIDGSSVVESYSSSLEMSSNAFNYTGSPQAIFESSDIVEDKSLYSDGGTYCPLSACTTNVMRNGKCDPICNVSLCGFDNGDCLCPIDTCPLSSRGNGVCDLGCASSGCNYDFGDCCNTELCTFDLRHNGICNRFCNNKACDYDDGECVGVAPAGSQVGIPVAAPSYVSILRSASSAVLLALDAYSSNVIDQHDNRVIGKYPNIHRTAAIPKATAIQCSSSTVSMGSTQVQVSNSDRSDITIQSSGCIGLTSCVVCGACGICRSSGCDTSMMDDACQTKVGAGAKCAPTISLASNNFSVTTCIAAGQKVSPASSADISKKQSDLSTGAIAGISISALVLVATVAIIVIAIVKRQASRQRNQSIVAMESMAEVQVDQAVLNPAAPAQCSADIDPTFVEVPVKTPSSAVIDPTFVEIPANAPSSDDADPTFVEVPANAQSSAVIDPTFVEVLANAPSSDDVDPTLVEVPSNEHPLQGLNVAATSLNP